MAHPEGFEPPTPRFEAWCSIQLSYGCADVLSDTISTGSGQDPVHSAEEKSRPGADLRQFQRLPGTFVPTLALIPRRRTSRL